MSDALPEPNPESSSGVYNPLADEAEAAPTGELDAVPPSGGGKAKKPHAPCVRMLRPSEITSYVEPAGQVLVGDYHLQLGSLAVFAGPGGVGKSRAVLALAIAGKHGEGEWLGFTIRRPFKTFWLQFENNLPRLRRDLEAMAAGQVLDDWIRISEPPEETLPMENLQFRKDLGAALTAFAPDLLVIDPLNQITEDATEKDIARVLGRIRQLLREAGIRPAVLIVHHTRKPKSDDRHKGRSLAYLLAGSYTLQSKPRSVILMLPVSDSLEDDRVVVVPAKCNDALKPAPRSAWRRVNSGYEPLPEFDWSAYDGDQAPAEAKVKAEHLRAIFEEGRKRLPQSRAAQALMVAAKVGRSAAYEALKPNGRFAELLGKSPDDDCLYLRSEQDEFSDGLPA